MFYTIDNLAELYGTKKYTTIYGEYHPQEMLRHYSYIYSQDAGAPKEFADFTTPASHEEIFGKMYAQQRGSVWRGSGRRMKKRRSTHKKKKKKPSKKYRSRRHKYTKRR
jgi:hypothetical protein